jgi:hypothetical protein
MHFAGSKQHFLYARVLLFYATPDCERRLAVLLATA